MAESSPTPLPALRPLEAHAVETAEGTRYLLRDPEGYSDREAWLSPQALFLAAQLDGVRGRQEVAAVFEERFGVTLEDADIDHLVDQLDASLFLDSPAFRARRDAIHDAFLAEPLRPATHTAAYDPDPATLPHFLDELFTTDGGPGALPGAAAGAPLRGVVAPHIDLHRGGPVYAHAYKAVAEAAPADTYVVLGTCHGPMGHPFAVCSKAYDTPLGPVPNDEALVDALRAGCPWAFVDELAHRQEHSIEFQAVFLRHLFRDRPVAMVPILVDGLHRHLVTGNDPADDEKIAAFLAVLQESIARLHRTVCFIAAVDLSHVGRHFGDPDGLTPERLAAVEASDRTLLDALRTGDAAAFYRAWATTGDATRVCGAAPLYAFRRLIDGVAGDLLSYRQCTSTESDLSVSCAAMAYAAR
jgi:AmmeMemoRadiSam system protein B